MKVKLDFVTNSSTTSFIGWGVCLEEGDIFKNEKLLTKCFENYKKSENADPGLSFKKFKEDYIQFPPEILEYIRSEILEHSCGPDGDECMIAGSPTRIKDDQTLGDYKKQIISELAEYGIIVETLTYIEEAWRDG